MSSGWFIYALGGGLGHFTRGLSLARQAARQGNEVFLLTHCSHVAGLLSCSDLVLPDNVHLLNIEAGLDKQAISRRVSESILGHEPDVLVVDTFPRGLLGDLVDLVPSISCRRVLVHRDLNPEYGEKEILDIYFKKIKKKK